MAPTDLTISIIIKNLKIVKGHKILLDGFPRNLEQALEFEKQYGLLKNIIYLECPADEMLKRLLYRMSITPAEERRPDDDEQVMRKRIEDFYSITVTAIDFYDAMGRVVKVNALQSRSQIYDSAKLGIQTNLYLFLGFQSLELSQASKALADKFQWSYLNFKDFCEKNSLKKCEEKVNGLVRFLDVCEDKALVICGFPQNVKQLRIFQSFKLKV